MKLDDEGDVQVAIQGRREKFTTLKDALLFVWENSEDVEGVYFNGKPLGIQGKLWK